MGRGDGASPTLGIGLGSLVVATPQELLRHEEPGWGVKSAVNTRKVGPLLVSESLDVRVFFMVDSGNIWVRTGRRQITF